MPGAVYARKAVYTMPDCMERFGIEYPSERAQCGRLAAVIFRGHRPVHGFERVMLYDPATGTTRSAIVGRGSAIDGVAIRRSDVAGAQREWRRPGRLRGAVCAFGRWTASKTPAWHANRSKRCRCVCRRSRSKRLAPANRPRGTSGKELCLEHKRLNRRGTWREPFQASFGVTA